MRDGCAGFFTRRGAGRGQGDRAREHSIAGRSRRPRPDDGTTWSRCRRRGSTSARSTPCGGATWRRRSARRSIGCDLRDPLPLPGGRMTLVHRVTTLDPAGGPFGLGLIRAEADIHPDDWFMACHFVDDRVMPGTLMYECCLHTLRIFLMRLGWVGARGQVAFEPVPGVASRLKCRGQVIESTRRGHLRSHDQGAGLPARAVRDRRRPDLRRRQADRRDHRHGASAVRDEPARAGAALGVRAATIEPSIRCDAADTERRGPRTGRVFDHDRILAFAIGKPSDAFGERYRVVRRGAVHRPLPGPPYQFLDRITRVDAEPWVMAAGGSAEAEYDVAARRLVLRGRSPGPHAVRRLARGRLAAVRLAGRLHGLGPDQRRATCSFATSAARPCQHRAGHAARPARSRPGFDVTKIAQHGRDDPPALRLRRPLPAIGLVYDGDTDFGFFQPARAGRAGRDPRRGALPSSAPRSSARAESFAYPDERPVPGRALADDRPGRRAGPRTAARTGWGSSRGSTQVDPDAWFFKAHFLDDPVWPGSLGLESFLQLLESRGGEALGRRLRTRSSSRRRWARLTAGPIAARSSRRTTA